MGFQVASSWTSDLEVAGEPFSVKSRQLLQPFPSSTTRSSRAANWSLILMLKAGQVTKSELLVSAALCSLCIGRESDPTVRFKLVQISANSRPRVEHEREDNHTK